MTTKTTPKRYYRSTDDKLIAGVCGGLAEYFNIDPTIVRLIAVILAMMTGGSAIIAYIALIIIVPQRPKASTKTSHSSSDTSSKTSSEAPSHSKTSKSSSSKPASKK